MIIRKLRSDEYDKLISLIDEAFEKKGDGVFEHILPKYYYKENINMVHIGAFDNEKLVCSIGIYPDKMYSKYGNINVACIGAVSTKKEYRGQGLFSKVMKRVIKECENMKLDMIFLGGNRVRYNHFGFEAAGRGLLYCVSNRSIAKLKAKEYSCSLLNDIKDIKECLKIYRNQNLYMDRTIENFVDVLKSWNCIPYVVKVDDKVVGYYSILEDRYVYELIYKKGYKDTVIKASLGNKEYINIKESIDKYDTHTLDIADWYSIEHSEMYKIFNYDNVSKLLNAKKGYNNIIKGLDDKSKIRTLLGDQVNKGLTEIEMYILECDRG